MTHGEVRDSRRFDFQSTKYTHVSESSNKLKSLLSSYESLTLHVGWEYTTTGREIPGVGGGLHRLTNRDVEAFTNFDSVKLTIRKPGYPMDGNKENSRNDHSENEHTVKLESSISMYSKRF